MSWFRRAKNQPPPRLLSATRLVVFDLETTGLNPRKDKPIAVAAVAIKAQSIALADQFSTVINTEYQSAPQAALAHRLDQGSIRSAPPPGTVFESFSSYVADSPTLAYHAAFDDQVLQRAYKANALAVRWQKSLDIASWLLWLHPELGPKPPTLDQALAFARIHTAGRRRHDARVDSMLTAQLVLTLLPKTYARHVHDWQELLKQTHAADRIRQINS